MIYATYKFEIHYVERLKPIPDIKLNNIWFLISQITSTVKSLNIRCVKLIEMLKVEMGVIHM